MSPCRHDSIVAFFEDGDPDRHGRMWACADCWRRFYPACETCVDVGHRNETHPEAPDPIAPYQLDEDSEDAISAIEANGQAKDAARRRE